MQLQVSSQDSQIYVYIYICYIYIYVYIYEDLRKEEQDSHHARVSCSTTSLEKRKANDFNTKRDKRRLFRKKRYS